MERPPCQQKLNLRPGRILRCAALVGLSLLLHVGLLPAAQFTTSLDRDTVILGERVTLTLSFEDASPGQMPQIPPIPGMRTEPSTSSSFQSSTGTDGKTHNVQSFSVVLSPVQVGEFTVPAMQVNVGGQKLTSAPLTIKVLATDPSAPPPTLATNQAFLWIVLPKKEIYLGEALIGELRLYVRSDVEEVSNLQLPNLTGDGFNTDKRIQGQQFQRRIGNAVFTVVPMSFSLVPVKTGALTVGPLSGSIMKHFGPRDFFGRYAQRAQLTINAEAQPLRVLPLPTQGVPADFSGAVGSYLMTATVGPTNVAVGDPITVRVRISGRGVLEAIRLPEQTAWKKFKTYTPNSNIETSDQFGLQGTKMFEQIISPESQDLTELPPLTFSYFDPTAKQYRTLTQPAVKLSVAPGGSSPLPNIIAPKAPDVPPAQQDIVQLRQRLGTVAAIGTPLVRQPWFLAAQVVPVIVWLGAWGWRKRTEFLLNNPRLRRQRQVEQTIRQGLGELRKFASENNSDEFFATLFRLLQEQLGERLDCPATAITEAVIDEKLRPRGVPEETLTALHGLFQSCNQARYAPIKSSEELAAMVPRFEQVIRELRELPL